jgi:hypothetical protein
MKKVAKAGAAGMTLSCFSCAAWTGPLMTCPESIEVGEQVQLSASQVDDALIWTIGSGDQANAIFILEDGTEAHFARTSNIDDSGTATGTNVIDLRGISVGSLTVHVKETMIGPPLGLPRPMGSAACTIEILEAAE